jgi:hypothetical protein
VRLKVEIGGEPFRLRRIDVAVRVSEQQFGGRRRTIGVAHVELDAAGLTDVEQYGDLSPETNVLIALGHIEADRGFAFARFAAVDQRDRILDGQATEVRRHGRRGEHLDMQEAIGRLTAVFIFPQVFLLLPLHAQFGDTGINRAGLGTGDPQAFGDGALVDDLDDDRGETCLLQDCRRRTTLNLHSRFRIDRHDEQCVWIKQPLQFGGVAFLAGAGQTIGNFLRQRSAERGQGFQQPVHIGGQRLSVDSDWFQIGRLE